MTVGAEFVVERIVQCMIIAALDPDDLTRRDALRWLDIWWVQWTEWEAEDGR